MIKPIDPQVDALLIKMTHATDDLHEALSELIEIFGNKAPLEDQDKYSNEVRVLNRAKSHLSELDEDIMRLNLENK